MKRPDQEQLEAYSRNYEKIDSELQRFCKGNDFQLEVNSFRQPCRILRKQGNPHILVDISLSENWREIPCEENLLHCVTVIAYYEPENSEFVWKSAHKLAAKIPFSTLQENLDCYLAEAISLINRLTPALIMEKGERQENLRLKYNV